MLVTPRRNHVKLASGWLSLSGVIAMFSLGFVASMAFGRRAELVVAATSAISGAARAPELTRPDAAHPLRVVLVLAAVDCEGWLTPLTRLARHLSLSGDTVDAVLFLDRRPSDANIAALELLTRSGRAGVAPRSLARRILIEYSRESPLVVGLGANNEIALAIPVPQVARVQDHLIQAIAHLAATASASARRLSAQSPDQSGR